MPRTPDDSESGEGVCCAVCLGRWALGLLNLTCALAPDTEVPRQRRVQGPTSWSGNPTPLVEGHILRKWGTPEGLHYHLFRIYHMAQTASDPYQNPARLLGGACS